MGQCHFWSCKQCRSGMGRPTVTHTFWGTLLCFRTYGARNENDVLHQEKQKNAHAWTRSKAVPWHATCFVYKLPCRPPDGRTSRTVCHTGALPCVTRHVILRNTQSKVNVRFIFCASLRALQLWVARGPRFNGWSLAMGRHGETRCARRRMRQKMRRLQTFPARCVPHACPRLALETSRSGLRTSILWTVGAC